MSTGPANPAIDLPAAGRLGITVCGTGYVSDPMREKRISTAAIDVYDIEPLPADHPLRTLPNALLTGHIAYVTDDLYRTFYQDSVEDIAAFQAGAPVRLMA